ncbi:MAG: hypothetical protein ACOX6T_06670 [Myxococcales bacterium]|jgi:hypothetical protein
MNRLRNLAVASFAAFLLLGAQQAGAKPGNGNGNGKGNGGGKQAEVFVSSGWSASRFIKAAEGGVVEIEGVARLTIPAGALDSDSVVSMLAELVEVNGERSVVVTFGPSGTAFRTPAKLELWPRLVRKANSAASLFYCPGVGEDGSMDWDELQIAEQSDSHGQGIFVLWIDHFSRYGVGYDLHIVLSGFVWNYF